MNLNELTIVIPTFNECKNIEKVINDWSTVCKKLEIRFQINIYDANSTDGTKEIINLIATKNEVGQVNLKVCPKLPHGPSVLMGYLEADTKWVFQMDSDDAFPTMPFELLWKNRDQFDVLVAQRVDRKTNYSRQLVSFTSKSVTKFLFKSSITDANSPYRLMNKFKVGELFKLLPADCVAPNVLLTGLFGLDKGKIYLTTVVDNGEPVGTAGLARLKLWKTAFKSFIQIPPVYMRYHKQKWNQKS